MCGPYVHVAASHWPVNPPLLPSKPARARGEKPKPLCHRLLSHSLPRCSCDALHASLCTDADAHHCPHQTLALGAPIRRPATTPSGALPSSRRHSHLLLFHLRFQAPPRRPSTTPSQATSSPQPSPAGRAGPRPPRCNCAPAFLGPSPPPALPSTMTTTRRATAS